MLLAGGASSLVEATLGFKRAGRLLFRNSPQLVFGGGAAGDGEAVVHFPDLPMLATLLDANLRRGRNVAAMDKARFLAVYDVAAPASATPDPAALMGSERVFTQRQLLGVAALESDGSLKVALPARRPLILELQDGGRQPIFTMREEHQLGPGENISPGVPAPAVQRRLRRLPRLDQRPRARRRRDRRRAHRRDDVAVPRCSGEDAALSATQHPKCHP